jgi:hypothetical protein
MLFAKGGKENIRDTGLRDVPTEEVQRRARDKNLPPAERQRYIREEKARKVRNAEKRSNYTTLDPEPLVIGGSAAVVLYGTYRLVRFLPSLLPPLWWTAPANAALP